MTDSRPEIQLYTATLGSQHQAELEHKRTWSGHSEEVTDLDWAPNQWLLASCSEDRTVRLWGTHQVLLSLLAGNAVVPLAWYARVRFSGPFRGVPRHQKAGSMTIFSRNVLRASYCQSVPEDLLSFGLLTSGWAVERSTGHKAKESSGYKGSRRSPAL